MVVFPVDFRTSSSENVMISIVIASDY